MLNIIRSVTERPAGQRAPRKDRRWGARGTAAVTFAAGLTFDGVTRRFADHVAVDDLSLEINAGEVVCLLGPSGCGKSTLLRLAAGIEKPNAGRILINDRVVAGGGQFVPPEQRSIGLMFQDFALFPHLSILANVAFGLRTVGSDAARRVAMAALERVGLAHYCDEFPHILSGGEQQRVALARAIAPRPSVLLMDEPFSGLDVQLRALMQDETRAILHETRATCIIVTHDPEEAMRLADRIAVMRAGRLVQVGQAEDLYAQPNDLFVARMFSKINEVHCVVRDGAVETPFGRTAVDDIADGNRVTLCIRQRAVSLVPTPPNNVAPGSTIRAGRVLDLRFLGDAVVVDLAVDGIDEPIRARIKEAGDLRRGREVGVEIDMAAALVFPEDEVAG